jgi:23S rRNA U2552 (ribose-2'-O)-methylase RlmE/FtsJ
MAVNSEQTLQLGEHTRATLWEINTIYQLQLDATGRKAEFSAQYDLWFLHVKVLINPNELISPPHTYLAQLRTANQELQRHNKKALIDPAYLATAGKDKGDTINRAYYKMQEFLTLFGPAMISPGPMHVCFLCESPGGFIQAFLDYRKPLASAPAPADQLVAISKRASGMPGSTWGKLQPKLARNYSWVRTTTTASSGSSTGSTNLLLLGDADTAAGDILVAASRNRVYEEFASAPAQLITADGGFDADSDTEEMDTAQLILAEIVMALQLGAEGSHFIIKIFDMTTQFTIDLVHVLAYAYNRLQVIKPASSRLASSEKYLVCSGLNAERGRQLAAQLEPVLAQPAPVSSAYYQSILAAGSCSPLISQAVQQYNNLFIERQNSFILSGTDYADRYLSMAEKGQHLEIIEAMRPWIKLPTETST